MLWQPCAGSRTFCGRTDRAGHTRAVPGCEAFSWGARGGLTLWRAQRASLPRPRFANASTESVDCHSQLTAACQEKKRTLALPCFTHVSSYCTVSSVVPASCCRQPGPSAAYMLLSTQSSMVLPQPWPAALTAAPAPNLLSSAEVGAARCDARGCARTSAWCTSSCSRPGSSQFTYSAATHAVLMVAQGQSIRQAQGHGNTTKGRGGRTVGTGSSAC